MMLTQTTALDHSSEWWTTTNIPGHKEGNILKAHHLLSASARTKTSIKSETGEINNTILRKWKLMSCSALPSGLNVKKTSLPTPTSVPSLTMLYLVGPEQTVLSKTQQLSDSHNPKKTENWHTHTCTSICAYTSSDNILNTGNYIQYFSLDIEL